MNFCLNSMNNNNVTLLGFISLVTQLFYKNIIPSGFYNEKKKELEQLANSLDENDNPVLMLVKLKE